VNRDIDRSLALAWVAKAPLGTRIEFMNAKRTLPQNDRMWAMLTEVSVQKQHYNQRYTPDEWKAIFMKACGHELKFIPDLEGHGFIPFGLRSSELSKEEMGNLIDFILVWGAQNGVVFRES
jgi:hypothetical protein